MMSNNQLKHKLLWAIACFFIGVSARPSFADAVKLGNFWIDGVTVNNITNGNIYYYNDIGDEFVKPLEQLQGLKLDRYPQLERYENASNQDDRAALEALSELNQILHEPWLRQWTLYLLTGAYDKLNQPVQALETFLQLAYSGPEEHYMASVSLRSILEVDEQVKQDIVARLDAARYELESQPQARAIERLIDQLKPGSGGDTPRASDPTTTTEASTTPPTDSLPSGGAAKINLPRVLDLGDSITKMILTGHYDQAVTAADRAIATQSRQISMRLFQKGIAQFRLAQAADDQEKYLDAGLSFMQVVIHFPESSYVGPSLVEAGLVHYKIGHVEIARRLLNQATGLIDTEEDAHYAQRLDELMAQVGGG